MVPRLAVEPRARRYGRAQPKTRPPASRHPGDTGRTPARRRILDDVRRRLVLGALVWAVATAGAFLLLDPVVGAAVAISGAVVLALVAAAADWERHSSFEDREMDRARRREEKWARGADARARDRARWEAHQARRADRAGRGDAGA